jgi:hypothetical protein
LQQRYTSDLHVNERSIAAAPPGVCSDHLPRSRALAEAQSFAVEFFARQQHVKLGAQDIGLEMLEELFERGIAHPDAVVYVENDHRLGMAREKELKVQVLRKGI